MPLACCECLPSILQDGLGLPVQWGLAMSQDKEYLKPDAWQLEPCWNVPGGATVPALETPPPTGHVDEVWPNLYLGDL